MADDLGKEEKRKGKRRVLIAAQARAAQVVQAMMRDTANLIPVQTTADAFRILGTSAFLVSVKATASLAHIPFLCSRVLVGALRDSLVSSMADACKACGAVDFVDVARMPADLAEATMRNAVETYLQSKSPSAGLN